MIFTMEKASECLLTESLCEANSKHEQDAVRIDWAALSILLHQAF